MPAQSLITTPPEIYLSVIIPAYNEETRLPSTLSSVFDYLHNRSINSRVLKKDTSNLNFEIIVVDDGSSDNTAKIIKNFSDNHPQVRLIPCPQNRGKGHAVRLGMLNARGKYLLFNDADGASPIEEIERLEVGIADGAQIAIGSRAMYSSDTKIEALLIRKLLGRTFNALVNFIILPGIADTQCGFKLFEREVAIEIFSKQKADRFSFDVEVLFLARKLGYKISEVPINWHNIPGSKVNLIKDSAAMLRDIFIFRYRMATGAYK